MTRSATIASSLLHVEDMSVHYRADGTQKTVVRRLGFELAKGEILAIVGESGSGKSTACLALPGLLPNAALVTGHAWLNGADVLALPQESRSRLCGRRIGFVFQDAHASLDPLRTVGSQLNEVLRVHGVTTGKARLARVRSILLEVGLRDPARVLAAYPHQLSGGIAQRVCIALALAGDPELLIADEPTSALDVTVQAQVLALIRRLCDTHGLGVILVTHDLAVVAEIADRMLVMYQGRIVESAPADILFATPAHPYTVGLMGAVPQIEERKRRLVPVPGNPLQDAVEALGCGFLRRCVHGSPVCANETPALRTLGRAHRVACHHDVYGESAGPTHLEATE